MSNDLPREPLPDASEGLPWQIIYAAFLGVVMSALWLYGGMVIINLMGDLTGVAVGSAVIAVGLAVGTAFVALLARARWAARVCRIFTPMSSVLYGGLAAWEIILQLRAPERHLERVRGFMPVLNVVFDVLFEPQVLLRLLPFAVSGILLLLLFNSTSRRFLDR